jgi:class 3 adenylate cyclase/tetratricopeptide (TPR) repeat protein/energy-coupling factor transporter ATP-binding protein EcfA2
MQCTACGEASHERARFCSTCGARLPVRCPGCNEIQAPEERVCIHCGMHLPDASDIPAKPASEAERRQISVMLCDLVGSTPLSGRLDPEDLAEVIRTYQSRVADAIAHFGGYIARYVGDGVLIYFGWPEGKEASSERAVRAALAVVAAVKETPVSGEKLQVRVGVATGIVIVGESIGSGEAHQQTAIGETPNFAARLQEVAQADSIVIDDVTRRHIGDLFTCHDLGELTLKGVRAPMRAWCVAGERAVDDRFAALHATRLVPLISREEELALLLHRWRQAEAGEGQIVLLTGEAGIGKSRLLAELRTRLHNEAHVSLRYFCSPYHQANPLYPVIARWEHDTGFVRGDGPADKLRKLQSMLSDSRTSPEDASLIADLLGLPVDESFRKLDLSPQRKKYKTYEALTRRVVNVAQKKPLLLLAEDVHWADPSFLELLDWITELTPNLRILLIVSFRPEMIPRWAKHETATFIALTRLNRQDTTRLATAVMTGHAIPPALLERIVTRSDGIPLFIEELTKSVLENAGSQAALPALLPVPDTLQALLTARLDRLPSAKRVAQIGSTMGRQFSHSLLAAVAQIPDSQLVIGLDELVDSGLASRRDELTDTIYTFKHALVQEAIYDSLLRRRRAEIHTRIVEVAENDASFGVIEPGLLGYHCAQAGLLAKAASYYRVAGSRSAARAAVAETRTYLERGLQFAGNLPDGADRHHLEAELLIALGRILMTTKGPNDPEVSMAFQRAVTVCRQLGNPEMLARALYSLGIIAEARAELVEGQAIGEELIDLAASSGDTSIGIAARVRLGVLAYHRGNFVVARDHLAHALDLCATGKHVLRDNAIASDPHVAEAYLSVALAHLGYTEQAITHGEGAVEGARNSGSSAAYALTLSVWSRTLEVLRDDVRCGACSTALVALSEEQGFSFLLAIGQCQLGWVTAMQGDISKGFALLSVGIAAVKTLGSRIRPEVGKYLLSDILTLSSQHAEALAMLDEVLEFSRNTRACWLDAELHRKKAELLLLGEVVDVARAEQEFRQAIDVARQQSAKLFELRAAIGLARLWSKQGQRARARELLHPLSAWFSKTRDIPDVREARALLAGLD